MRKYLVMAVCFLMSGVGQGKMVKVETIRDVKAQIEKFTEGQNPEDVLVAFDIDMTLTAPQHKALAPEALALYRDVMKQSCGALTEEGKDIMLSYITQTLPHALIDPESPQVIQGLRQRGYHVMALTAVMTGSLKGLLPMTVEENRTRQLHELGLIFQPSFCDADMTLIEIPAHGGGYPRYFKGLLFANGERGAHTKGTVLAAFLKKTEDSFKVIILVDDKKKNLEDVEAALLTHDPDIRFLGLEYEDKPCQQGPLISREEFQAFWDGMAQKASGAARLS